MQNLSNILNNSNKKFFNAKVEITLEGGIKINGDIQIQESLKSYAKDAINKKLNDSNLTFKILNIEEVVKKESKNKIVKEKEQINENTKNEDLFNVDDILKAKNDLIASMRKPVMHNVEELDEKTISIATNDEYSTIVEIKGFKK